MSGCTAGSSGRSADTAPLAADLRLPSVGGAGSIAPELRPSEAPSAGPVQAGAALAGSALPTNQWWTSALTGPLSQPLWAHPLAVRAGEDGLAISSQPATVSADAVVTPFVPSVSVPGRPRGLSVTGYGAFDVRFDVAFDDGSLGVTVVQGSPVVWLSFGDGLPTAFAVPEAAQLGRLTTVGEHSVQSVLVGESTWELVSDAGTTWRRDGDLITAEDGGGRVAVAIAPQDVGANEWAKALTDAAAPVTATREQLSYDADAATVTQTLVTERDEGRSLWALLPHLASAVTGDGTWPNQLGEMGRATGNSVTTTVPMPGLLTAVPDLGLDPTATAAVSADLAADLAAAGTPGGSYFGSKEMGRLAVLAEVAAALGDDAAEQQALDRLRPLLTDLLSYDGLGDTSFLGYDPDWGGIVAVPPEFGSQDYNDHHFQYGYVLYAAAVLGASEPSFVTDYGDVVNLLVRDIAGRDAAPGNGGLPAFRVWNAYEGHSAASGFSPFADGNNQESSSEAVHAWEGVLRWGLVTGQDATVEAGVTRYAWEAASARRYWLGETGARPAGFGHTVIGILWGAKTDYATFFDPAPEAVEGIQLLPLTMGSLYRGDPAAAAVRSARLEAAVGGAPRTWGDLFAVDLALSDPDAARTRLDGALPREPSTSAALTRVLVELLARHGPPQAAVVADGPFGLALGSVDSPTLIATNPTAEPRVVTFRNDGRVLAKLDVSPGETVVQPG